MEERTRTRRIEARPDLPHTFWEVWRTGHRKPSYVGALRRERLARIVEFARQRSPYYSRLYASLAARGCDFGDMSPQRFHDLPPMTKPELMANFDEWVTDRAVTIEGVRNFVADKSLIGQPYLGRYAVWSTSGISGRPGIFLHDLDAVAVYGALLAMRGWLGWVTPRLVWDIARRGGRVVTVISTGGHFSAVSFEALIHNLYPRQSGSSRIFSALLPLPELVRKLNDFQPALLLGYPTIMALLAKEQAEGRLHIAPSLVGAAGEWLSESSRAEISRTFGCLVREAYAASEFMGMAFECRYGWQHVSADWLVLEPVDEHYRLVAPGRPSHSVLLTNLANHVQPLIRYDLGDSVTLRPGRCPCGNPFPAIRVEGRRDEVLYMRTPHGRVVPLLPRALATMVGEVQGVYRLQVVQTAPDALSVRLEVTPGAEMQQVWAGVERCLRDYLIAQGLPLARLELSSEPPRQDPVSGKFRQVWADLRSALVGV